MSEDLQQGGRPLQAWWTVAVFCGLYAVSMLDRWVLMVLVGPVAKSLSLSDEQTGILFGTGFAIVYTLVGLPIAHRLDKKNRKVIVVTGVLTWSFSTIASAFAHSYEALLFFRAGLAAGEAVLTPAAISIFADLFPPHRRSFPTALYVSSGSIMTPGAFMAGAALLHAASNIAAADSFEPWRLTLVFVGLPGVVLATVLLITVKEPKRASPARPQLDAPVKDGGFFAGNFRLWAAVFTMQAVCAVAYMGGLAWTTTLLVREFGLTEQRAGLLFGAMGIAGSIAAIVCWPALDVAIHRLRGRSPAALLYLIATLGAAAVVVVTGTATSVTVILGASALAMFFINGSIVLPNLMIQTAAPSTNQARLAAMLLLSNGLIGTGAGPLITAAVASRILGSPAELATAMAAVGLCALPVIIGLGLMVLTSYRRAIETRNG